MKSVRHGYNFGGGGGEGWRLTYSPGIVALFECKPIWQCGFADRGGSYFTWHAMLCQLHLPTVYPYTGNLHPVASTNIEMERLYCA